MRSTTNANVRGNTRQRSARRLYLVTHYRADVDHDGEPACRCYRCGQLLTTATVTADRRIPGCEGGTYHRENIRPACRRCNSQTGGVLGARRSISTKETGT